MAKYEFMKFRGLPFGIGSLPHIDPRRACLDISRNFPKTPFWPELPRRNFKERMGFIQTEGVPGINVDESDKKIYLRRSSSLTDEIGDFYNRFLERDLQSMAITPEYSAGFKAMKDIIMAADAKPLLLKGQLSGPTTFGLILKDETGKALLYDEQMMDVLIKSTIMKAQWMLNEINKLGIEAVIFFDEPMLQSVGSPSVPINKEQAIRSLNEIIDAVDCLTGAHCCGNTDWSILLESNINIIAFDAYHFTETMALYPQALNKFLERGGALAWGIVPSSDEARGKTIDEIVKLLQNAFNVVAKSGINKKELISRAIVTPSCGLGSLPVELATEILELTRGVSNWLIEQ